MDQSSASATASPAASACSAAAAPMYPAPSTRSPATGRDPSAPRRIVPHVVRRCAARARDGARGRWGFVVAAVLTLALTPVVRRLAVRYDLLDHGGDRPRIHKRPIPRIGGLAIAIGILVPALLFLDLQGAILGIVIGIPLVAAVGMVDDVRGLSASVKLLAVMAVACVPVIGFGMTFDRIGIPFVGIIDFGPAAVPITLVWIALVANLVNLIDGMDALAAGIVAIASASFALLAVSFGRIEVAALAAMVCGATIAFLRHNYHPATIFMGDTGALTLGFVLGALAVEGALKTPPRSRSPPRCSSWPCRSSTRRFVVAKRLKYGRRPWAPDQNHFYHRFLRIGFTQRRTAAYLHVWAAVLAGYSMLLRFVPPRPGGEWDASTRSSPAPWASASWPARCGWSTSSRS